MKAIQEIEGLAFTPDPSTKMKDNEIECENDYNYG